MKMWINRCNLCLQVATRPRMKLKRRPKLLQYILTITHNEAQGRETFAALQTHHSQNTFCFCSCQVRFARPESEQARRRRIQSYEFLQKKQAEEPWVHLQYHGVKVKGQEKPSQSASYARLWAAVDTFGDLVFDHRTDAQIMKNSTCSVRLWTPPKTQNWSNRQSESQ